MIRAHPMGVATIAIAVAAIAVALLAAVEGGGMTQSPGSRPSHSAAQAELARCRALGPDGPADPLCQSTWAAQRERFFGRAEEGAPATLPRESGR